jgi:hypothetical protein
MPERQEGFEVGPNWVGIGGSIVLREMADARPQRSWF